MNYKDCGVGRDTLSIFNSPRYEFGRYIGSGPEVTQVSGLSPALSPSLSVSVCPAAPWGQSSPSPTFGHEHAGQLESLQLQRFNN